MFVIYSSPDAYENDKRNVEILRMVLASCEKFEGKEISQRIVTHLSKEFSNFRFHLDKQVQSCPYLHVTPIGQPILKTVRICLPYNKIWNAEHIWNKSSTCMGAAAQQRISDFESYNSSDAKKEIERMDSEIETMKKRIKEIETEQDDLLKLFFGN